MAKTAKLGFKAVIYKMDAADDTGATAAKIEGMSDCNLEFSRAELDASTRDSEIDEMEPGKATVTVTGKIRNDVENAGFTALQDSVINRSVIRVLVLNAPKTADSAYGFAFDAKNFSWTEDQGLGAVIFNEFSLKPCVSSFKKRAVVAAGVLTLTDI